jgi:MoaA/NifB/PqqE/SkfB family radical SAM enzyme
MKQQLNRIRLFGNILRHNCLALMKGKLGLRLFCFSLKKQIILSSLFKDAKHVRIGNRTFIDPFAPYYPSSYFNRLMDNNSVNTFPLRPIHGQIAITDQCPCNCSHCHVENTQRHHLSRREVFGVIEDMAKLHFPLVFFVGGEPVTRLNHLCEYVRCASQFMDTRIFTSGVGATYEGLKRLKESGLNGVCVSLDHFDETIHNARRNNPSAFKSACNTVRWSRELKFYVSLVCCTTRTMIRRGETFAMVDFAESLGAHSIQLNEIRPVGKAQKNGNDDFFLKPEDKEILIRYYKKQNRNSRKIAVVMPWYNEEPDRFGCTATSGQHAYVDAQGNVLPCVLLKASIGNIRENSFFNIWNNFSRQCRYPVKECILYPYKEIISRSAETPLPPKVTMESWKAMCAIGPTEIFQKIQMKEPV